jgi:hypothetical protein
MWRPGVHAQRPLPGSQSPNNDNRSPNDIVPPQFIAKAKFDAEHADVRQLKQTRLDVAKKGFDAQEQEFLAGRGTLELAMSWSERLLIAQLAVLEKPAERKAARERHWTRLRTIEEAMKQRFDAGRVTLQDYLSAKYNRLGAEIEMAEERPSKPAR